MPGRAATLALDGTRVVVRDKGTTARIDLATLAPDRFGYALSAEETYDPPTDAPR